MARGTTAAGVDFAVLSARAERERQGTLLASSLTGGSHMSGKTQGAQKHARRSEPAPAGRPEVMNLLAAIVLAAASARVESVGLTTLDSRLAVRVVLSGTPGMVAVHREGDVARVSIMDAALGLRFAGGRRFSWTPSDGFDPALLAATPAKLDRIEIAATASEVSVLLHVPPDVAVDVRRDSRGVLVVFRSAPAEPERVARAAPVATPAPPLRPEPTPVRGRRAASAGPGAGRRAARSRPPCRSCRRRRRAHAGGSRRPRHRWPRRHRPRAARDTAELAKKLFPAAPADAQAAGSGSVAELYPRLFPTGVPAERQPEAAVAPVDDVVEPGRGHGGRGAARSACAPRWTRATSTPTRSWRARSSRPATSTSRCSRAWRRWRPVGEGSFTLEYAPVFRAFATYDQVNSSSHTFGAGLELPGRPERDPPRPGPLPERRPRHARGGPRRRVLLRPRPLPPQRRRRGREHRGRPAPERRARRAPPARCTSWRSRTSSTTTRGRARPVSGFEVTPNLKAIASYVYDAVPRPDERPEAESTAHSARA